MMKLNMKRLFQIILSHTFIYTFTGQRFTNQFVAKKHWTEGTLVVSASVQSRLAIAFRRMRVQPSATNEN